VTGWLAGDAIKPLNPGFRLLARRPTKSRNFAGTVADLTSWFAKELRY